MHQSTVIEIQYIYIKWLMEDTRLKSVRYYLDIFNKDYL